MMNRRLQQMSELTAPPVKMHRVKYDLQWTKNMGNFESLKINVGLEADGEGNPDVTMAKVRAWVEDNLGRAVNEVVDTIEGNNKDE
jgi:hypothetical protein